jgi:hypothetical protein
VSSEEALHCFGSVSRLNSFLPLAVQSSMLWVSSVFSYAERLLCGEKDQTAVAGLLGYHPTP